MGFFLVSRVSLWVCSLGIKSSSHFQKKKNGTSNWLKVLQFVSGTDLMSMISEFLKDASVCLWH